MDRATKWVTGTKPDQAVTKVARRAVRRRLQSVWHYAHLAAQRSGEDTAYVHHLRVSCRRARIALRVFTDVLPPQEMPSMKRSLKELRRAAGDARDLDVLAGHLEQIAEDKKGGSLKIVVGHVRAQREKAQEKLKACFREQKKSAFADRAGRLTRSIQAAHGEAEPRFSELARTALRPMVEQFFAAADADLSDVAALHEMRICGKQVRYAMELLAGAFDKSFREAIYPILVEVQEKLGTINDRSTAIVLYETWFFRSERSGKITKLGKKLIAGEKKQLQKACQLFRDWWSDERVDDLQRRFEGILQCPELNRLARHPKHPRVRRCARIKV